VAWAINMGIMAVFGGVFKVGRVDSDASVSLLRSVIDRSIVLEFKKVEFKLLTKRDSIL